MLGTLSDSDKDGGDGEDRGTSVLDWLSASEPVGEESQSRDEEEETDMENFSGREREVEFSDRGEKHP